MKVTIDTENKTIEIELATTSELKKLCNDYKGFRIVSEVRDGYVWNYPYWHYTYPNTIYTKPPTYITTNVTSGDNTDITYGSNCDNVTYTTN